MIVNRILQIIEYKGINRRKFYIETGLSNGFLDKVKDVGASKIEQILRIYPEINPEWLLTGKGHMLENAAFFEYEWGIKMSEIEEPSTVYEVTTTKTLKKQFVPVYDVETTDGMVSLFKESEEKPIDYVSVPNLPKCDGAIYVSGDRMYPFLKSGDLIIYKKMRSSIEHIIWGEMYLVSVVTDDPEEFLLIRWVQKSDKGEEWIKLVSENSRYESKDVLLKNVEGLALIKATIRINSNF
ncbi:helix-turn-helix transcriptional regulator [Flavobacterium tructae]|uniref:S24 family peptidase n=1 Tax=Flavobacterium tructae TaxID=1114873 RepID=UPI0035A886FA